jgi:bifunctional non-homologous end joining protein LigD
MFKAFEFCLPTKAKAVPAGPEWFHENRLRLERDGDRVRLITKGGYDRTKRYPRVVEASLRNRHTFSSRPLGRANWSSAGGWSTLV